MGGELRWGLRREGRICDEREAMRCIRWAPVYSDRNNANPHDRLPFTSAISELITSHRIQHPRFPHAAHISLYLRIPRLSSSYRPPGFNYETLLIHVPTGGISQFFPLSLQSVIIGCYVILFGLGTALLEFQQPPQQISRYASFMFSFLGRGLFYIFIGSILLHDGALRVIAGSIVGFVGLGYGTLRFYT
jgi:hypothetical protein